MKSGQKTSKYPRIWVPQVRLNKDSRVDGYDFYLSMFLYISMFRLSKYMCMVKISEYS